MKKLLIWHGFVAKCRLLRHLNWFSEGVEYGLIGEVALKIFKPNRVSFKWLSLNHRKAYQRFRIDAECCPGSIYSDTPQFSWPFLVLEGPSSTRSTDEILRESIGNKGIIKLRSRPPDSNYSMSDLGERSGSILEFRESPQQCPAVVHFGKRYQAQTTHPSLRL